MERSTVGTKETEEDGKKRGVNIWKEVQWAQKKSLPNKTNHYLIKIQ